MSDTSMSEDAPQASERRRHVRQRIESLWPVALGPDNGGIVLNISEGGLAIQVVGRIAKDALLEMRVGLPTPGEAFEANCQVAWTSRSKRQAGVVFVDLAEEARAEIREWISKQRLSHEPQEGWSRQTEKDKRVVSMPLPHLAEARASHIDRAHELTDLNIEAMFPSEKNAAARRGLNISVSPSQHSEPDPLEQTTSVKDSLASMGQRAKAASESAPEISKTASPPAPHAEETAIRAPSDGEFTPRERPPLTPPVLPVRLEPPPAPALDVAPPVAQSDAHTTLSATRAWLAEPTLAIPNLKNPTAAEEGTTLPETNETVVSFPTSREVAAERDALPPSTEKSSPSPSEPVTQPENPAVFSEEKSTEEMIAGLRAAIERTNGGKSAARREALARRLVDEQRTPPGEQSDTGAPPSPVASADPAPGRGTLSDSSGIGLASAAGAAIGEAALGDRRPKPSAKGSSPDPDIYKKEPVPRETRRASTRSSWLRSGMKPEQTATLVLLIALSAGVVLIWRALESTRAGRTATAIDSVTEPIPQALEDIRKPSELNDTSPKLSSSERAERSSARSRRENRQLSSATPSGLETESALSSPTPATNQAMEAATLQQETSPAREPQSVKIGNATVNDASAEKGGTADDSSRAPTGVAITQSQTPAAKIALPPPTDPAPQTADAGDRVVPSSLLYSVQALYPPDAARKHIEGTVKLTAVISKDGRVMGLGVVSGPAVLVPAALNAAREWRYVPALLNGEPVETQTDITIEFHLPTDTSR